VLVVDRARFPSEIPHGHFIHRGGPARLARWGLLDDVVATGAPPVTRIAMELPGGFMLRASGVEADGVPFGIAPRRRVFDALLLEAAARAGAEVRVGFPVDGPLFGDDGTVTGVRSRGTTERARLTIGADGRNSGIAKAVGAPFTRAEPPETCWYFSYWSGLADEGLEIRTARDRVLFKFPTNDGLTGVFMAWPLRDLPRVRADVDTVFMVELERWPDLAERLAAGRRQERWLGATQLPNHVRRPHGPGWALVGDAGVHKDPYLALGMCDALRDAELLADAAGAGLTGEQPLAEALAGYERARDEHSLPDFEENLAMARFEPPPADRQRLYRALLQAEDETVRRFQLAAQGLAPLDEAMLGRLMAAG
jgi:flavin-dependent dehydrogenase